MKAANVIIPCGIVCLVIGLVIRLYIGKRRFDRRNGAGLQQFRNYGHALFTSAWERAVLLIADLITAAGGLLLAAAAFTHLKF